MIIPKKLLKGDEVRVVAPARSLAMPWISDNLKEIAKNRFAELGLKLTFGKNVMEIDDFNSSSIMSRVEDLHEAFKDKKVKAIITVIGGYNSIEILPHLDYYLIENNPKILCGYSDITALSNAIHAKTGLITYSGPHFFDFGDKKGFDYTLDYFKKCLMSNKNFSINPSEKWSDDKWGKDQENRNFVVNNGFRIINKGECSGKLIGGNLCTLQLLQGTKYWPDLKDSVLFIEDDSESYIDTFSRDLSSLSMNKYFAGVKGIIIGRFQNASEVDLDLLEKKIKSNIYLSKIPIIANVDFGHTTPRLTLPVGGEIKMDVKENEVKLSVETH